jgi:cyclase
MTFRVIPVLLIHKGGLYKSVKFKDYKYVGDPINAVKIFNEKEVDEIAIIDIDASREKRAPRFDTIADITAEAFMPVAYGGGITQLDEIKKLMYNGVEKVILNYAASQNFKLVTQAATQFGNQSVVVSIDFKKDIWGKRNVYTLNGTEKLKVQPLQYAIDAQNAGAGELMLNSIDNDGTYKGYDLELIGKIATTVNIPVIACGGASGMEDFVNAKKVGASAAAAGSMFVFQRPHQAVLISYPTQADFREKLF